MALRKVSIDFLLDACVGLLQRLAHPLACCVMPRLPGEEASHKVRGPLPLVEPNAAFHALTPHLACGCNLPTALEAGGKASVGGHRRFPRADLDDLAEVCTQCNLK